MIPGFANSAQPFTYDGTDTVVYFVPDRTNVSSPDLSSHDADSDITSECSQHSASTLSSQEARAYFRDVGGRLYPVDPDIPVFMPQDEQETRRLDHEHNALKLVIGRNYVGPVDFHLRNEPQFPRKRVLDIGTQQGTWVQEMASEFPHVEFVSLDLSPMAAHTPRENVAFEVYNFHSGLAEPDASFDVAHMRHTASKVGNYVFLVRELHRVLRPGGLLIAGEFENEAYGANDPETPLRDTSPYLSRALALVRQSLAAQNVTIDAGRQLPAILADPRLFARALSSLPTEHSDSANDGFMAGFTNITSSTYNIPSSPWPDPHSFPNLHEAGRQAAMCLRYGWPSLVPLLTVHAGLSIEDARELLSGALAESALRELRQIMKFHTVWAVKAGEQL